MGATSIILATWTIHKTIINKYISKASHACDWIHILSSFDHFKRDWNSKYDS